MSHKKEQKDGISRRRFLQIVAVCGAAGGLYKIGEVLQAQENFVVRQSRSMMGTQINLVVCGPDKDQCHQAVVSTFAKMGQLERELSRHKGASDLFLLNQSGAIDNPPESLLSVLSLADEISKITEGAFDVTVLPLLSLYESTTDPANEQLQQALKLVDYSAVEIAKKRITFAKPGMAVTLDGIGKGYVVDQGVQALKENGFDNVYVEAGGDLMVTGSKPKQDPWKIGIRNPRPENVEDMMVMRVNSSAAIATSGDYMHFFTEDKQNHHILDPRTGISPPELASATVAAPNVALADGLATAAMVMGAEKSLALLEDMDGCEGLFIDKGLQRYKTSGFTV